MNKFKEWLIHLCGGLTREEAKEEKIENVKAGPHYFINVNAPIVTFKKVLKYDREFSPVVRVKEQIAREIGEMMLDEHLIEWQSECNDSFIGMVCGTVRVVKPNYGNDIEDLIT